MKTLKDIKIKGSRPKPNLMNTMENFTWCNDLCEAAKEWRHAINSGEVQVTADIFDKNTKTIIADEKYKEFAKLGIDWFIKHFFNLEEE